jgi:hypothetical protein
LGSAVVVAGGEVIPGMATPPKGALDSIFSVSVGSTAVMVSGSSFKLRPCMPETQPFVAG